jgi:hypothetical protein
MAQVAELGYLGRTMPQRRAGKTVKISVSLQKDDVAALKRHAKEEHGGNLSAAVSELVRGVKQRQAMWKALDMLGGVTLTDAERAAIDAEFAGGPRYEPDDFKDEKS